MISICIPTLNTKQFLGECIQSIKQFVTLDYEINVLDLGNDGSDELAVSEGANCWRRNLPCYFGESCDYLCARSKGDLILFLNSDVVLTKYCVERMAEVDNGSVVGAMLIYPPKSEVAPGYIQHAGVILKGNQFRHRGYRSPRLEIYSRTYEVVAVTGACMMVEKAVYNKIGGFDQRFKNCYEDVDFCLRAWHTGHKVVYRGDAVAWHWEARTMGTTGKTPTSLEFQHESQALLTESMAKYGDVVKRFRDKIPY